MIIVEIKLCHPVWIEHGLSYVKIMVCINLLYAIGARDLLLHGGLCKVCTVLSFDWFPEQTCHSV
jgi:hypothetical protein